MYACLLLISALQLNSTDNLSSLLEQAKPANSKIVRLEALKELREAGSKNPTKTCQSLVPYLYEKDAEIRDGAVLAIGLSGYKQNACALALVEALNDPNKSVRLSVTTVLIVYKQLPKEAAPILFAAVKSKDRNVRSSVTSLLVKSLGNTPRVLKTLRQLFSDSDQMVRDNAHITHFQLTGDMGVYVPHLLRITATRKKGAEPKTKEEERERDLREVYVTTGAIRLYEQTRLRPHDLAKALVDNLSHKDAAIRQCALRQLRAMCINSKRSFRAVDRLKLHDRLDTMGVNDENDDVGIWALLVRDILKEGPPKAAPEELKPYSELVPAESDKSPDETSADESE